MVDVCDESWEELCELVTRCVFICVGLFMFNMGHVYWVLDNWEKRNGCALLNRLLGYGYGYPKRKVEMGELGGSRLRMKYRRRHIAEMFVA